MTVVNKNYRWWYGLMAALFVVYSVEILGLTSDSSVMSHFKVNDMQLRLLNFGLAVPMMAIWFAGFYGFINVLKYVSKIKGGLEYGGFRWLGLGLAITVIGTPITSVIARWLQQMISENHFSLNAYVVITNYLSLLFPLIGFIMLLVGANMLYATLKSVRISMWRSTVTGIFLVTLSVLYTWVVLSNPARTVTVPPAISPTYALSDALIVTTIIIPNVIMWIVGFYTVLMLSAYYRNIRGKLYRSALKNLTRGFAIIIVLSIILQFLIAALNILSGWSLGAFLALLYALIIAIAVGYLYIALGAKGLSKLEDVT